MDEQEKHGININCFGYDECLVPHKKHVEMLKQFAFRGHTVVVWSQGGSDWAEAAVEALGLQKYVDIIMPKPYWFFDDIPSSVFMTESMRIFKDDTPYESVMMDEY